MQNGGGEQDAHHPRLLAEVAYSAFFLEANFFTP